MKNKKYLFFVGALFLTLSSCVKDQPTEEEESALITSGNGVYIINEGNFQFGNASVSYYDVDTKTLKEDIYKTANSIALGDVAQSMAVLNNKAYIVVNNSSKIEVVNAQTFVSVATIAGLPSPRYFLAVNNAKAYVSDYKANVALKVSPKQFEFQWAKLPMGDREWRISTLNTEHHEYFSELGI